MRNLQPLILTFNINIELLVELIYSLSQILNMPCGPVIPRLTTRAESTWRNTHTFNTNTELLVELIYSLSQILNMPCGPVIPRLTTRAERTWRYIHTHSILIQNCLWNLYIVYLRY